MSKVTMLMLINGMEVICKPLDGNNLYEDLVMLQQRPDGQMGIAPVLDIKSFKQKTEIKESSIVLGYELKNEAILKNYHVAVERLNQQCSPIITQQSNIITP